MIKNWSDIGQVTVREYHGGARTYASLSDAVRAVGHEYIAALRGDHIAYPPTPENVFRRPFGGDTHCFYDQYSLRIPVWKVKEAWNNLPVVWESSHRWNRRRYYFTPETFRKGPIPGTGRARWKFSSYYRYPKTLQEHRWAEALRADREELLEYSSIPLKARDRDNYLPTAWDDVPRSEHAKKNWKAYRKHQYK